MDKGARNWLYKYARLNLWKVYGWYDLDDLIQDGIATYYRIMQRYPRAKTPAHIMSLFKISFINHVIDLARDKQRAAEILIDDLVPMRAGECPWDAIMCEPDPEILLLLQIRAPALVRGIMQLHTTDEGRAKLLAPYLPTREGRETMNERWCKLMGCSPRHIDLVDFTRRNLTYHQQRAKHAKSIRTAKRRVG